MQVEDHGSQAGADPLDLGSSRRRLVEIRCGFAELAHREAEAAEARVADTRRLFDAQLAVLAEARAAADPGAIRAAKEQAHRTFRVAIDGAGGRPQVELAAASWLAEINRINTAARSSQTRIQRERHATDALAAELDRLTAISEAGRAMAQTAAEACRSAREALVATQGKDAAQVVGDASSDLLAELMSALDAAQTAPIDDQPAAPRAALAMGDTLPGYRVMRPQAADPSAGAAAVEKKEWPVDLGGPKPPTIVRLLQRDNAAMSHLVDWLSGPHTDQRRRWQICLSDFVDALAATAIDNSCFTFAPGNPFWDQLTPDEARNVARGLAGLGFRHDGMGEFADGRVPGKRELSMAVGQAGMLPVRIRYWPRPEEIALLYRSVRADPVALIAEQAPSITMGELVRLLGRRAEMAADLWNDWSRARPLLLLPSRD